MDPIDALELSWNQGKTVIDQLTPDLLGKPSECEGWDIRATLNHTLNVCQMMTRSTGATHRRPMSRSTWSATAPA